MLDQWDKAWPVHNLPVVPSLPLAQWNHFKSFHGNLTQVQQGVFLYFVFYLAVCKKMYIICKITG